MQRIKRLLSGSKFNGVIDVSLKNRRNVVMATTRIINPEIDSGKRAAVLNDKKNQVIIGFENVADISSKTYYDGSEDYSIEYEDGVVLYVTFKM